MREQRIVLKQVRHAAGLRRQADARLRIEQHPAVDVDAPGIRPQQACHGAQRQALARAGRPEQGDALGRRRECDIQFEMPVA
ncbi:hypothetical protein G6F57_021387 [Rhizopus arrhizus]|nr:hypothetical protein G6F22_018850 [Rhizopus arrhizus]KAG1291244.1 hypothetical protein G6F63_016979 [Rhizopus arrhizus]KAG1434872.1 hypothetical protein G6F57_021387 [Rhizopus arrhizus]